VVTANNVKNKKSLIHFRGTLKNNFFTNNPQQQQNHGQASSGDHHGSLTLNNNDSANTISGAHLHHLNMEQQHDSIDGRRMASGQ